MIEKLKHPLVSRNKTYILCLIPFAVFYLWMAAQIPYTHDDWDWGLEIGIQQLLHATINSRYAGNFFEVVMTRSEFAKAGIMGAGYFLIPYLIVSIAEADTKPHRFSTQITCFTLSNVLLFTMDRQIWRQTCGWVAGFSNFVISTFFLLIVIQRVFCVFGAQQQTEANCIHWAFAFLLCLWGQLFIENIAIITVALLTIACLFYRLKHKAVSATLVSMLAGAVAGMVIMFSSNIYTSLVSTGEAIGGYRHLNINAADTLPDILYNCWQQALKLPYLIWENNLVLSLFILAVMSIAMLCRAPGGSSVIFLLVNAAFGGYFILNYLIGVTSHAGFKAFINILYFLVIGAETFLAFRTEKAHMRKLLAVWSLAPGIILPLIATSEAGPRLFFPSTIVEILFVVMAVYSLLADISVKNLRMVCLASVASAVLVLSCHGAVYAQIGTCSEHRSIIIAEATQNNANTIILPKYPHEAYLWLPTPTTEERLDYFKQFYSIDPDVNVVFK